MADRPPLAILAGVRVLSFTQFLLGPSGVQFLVDLGADVVKIEPPGGTLWERNWSGCNLYLNGESAFFLLAHRNQRSLTLDLKTPSARAVARRLVERADVLVENFRPGVTQRFGLDWETVKSRAGGVQTHAETFADSAGRAADAVEDIAHPLAGRVRMLRFPVEFSSGRATGRRPPLAGGQHTDEILREAGYDNAEIRGLRADGAG